MRVVSILEKSAGMDEDPEAEEALNLALDELAIARAAAAFEMLSGPINWKKRSLRQFAQRNRTAGFFTHANTLVLGLQPRFVRGYERANIVRHIEQLQPLFAPSVLSAL